jgi:hypothetical protein
MNCASCRYWIELDGQHPLDGFGACGRMRAGMYDPDAEIVGELAVVIEGSGLFAALKCKGDFGCVLHEPVVP